MPGVKGQVHIDRGLTDLSIAYMNGMEDFVSPQAFPIISTDKPSDLYYEYDKGAFFQNLAKLRASCTESVGTTLSGSWKRFATECYAIHDDVCRKQLRAADQPLNLEQDAVELVTHQLLLQQEVSFASRFMTNAGNWAVETELTGADKWDASGNPLKQLRAKACAMKAACGYYPNTLMLSHDAWCCMQDNDALLDRLSGGGSSDPASVKKAFIAAELELDRVLVSSAVVADASGAISAVSSKAALLMYVNPRPSVKAPSAGYTFSWDEMGLGLNGAPTIERIDTRLCKSIRIEGEVNYEHKLVSADLGCLLYNVCA